MRGGIEWRGDGSGPRRQRRQRHQDGFRIAAGHQTELGAAVVDQVEFDVAAAALELPGALGLSVRLVAAPLDDRQVGVEERLAAVLDERERGLAVDALPAMSR